MSNAVSKLNNNHHHYRGSSSRCSADYPPSSNKTNRDSRGVAKRTYSQA